MEERKHKYFTIEELSRSNTAKELGIENTPTGGVVSNLHRLIEDVLDPLREAFGKPIKVNSGYRCTELNDAVKGSKTSDHLYGNAADITAICADRKKRVEMNRELFSLAISIGLNFKQLIDEYGFSWVHISYDPKSGKHEVKHIK